MADISNDLLAAAVGLWLRLALVIDQLGLSQYWEHTERGGVLTRLTPQEESEEHT